MAENNAVEQAETSPIAFFLSGVSFLQTALLAHQAITARSLKLRFDMPVYYL
jgi:hypothetical protein